MSILPAFYVQLLHEHIPKAQKFTDNFFTLLGFLRAKSAHKKMMKLTPEVHPYIDGLILSYIPWTLVLKGKVSFPPEAFFRRSTYTEEDRVCQQ